MSGVKPDLRLLPRKPVDEEIIDHAEHGQSADGPEGDLAEFAAHQGLILAGLDADPAEDGAPDGGSDEREEGELQVVHPHDAGGDADQVTHDGQEARGEDAEAAKLRGPALGLLDLGRRDEEVLAEAQHERAAGPAREPVHHGGADPGAERPRDHNAHERHVAGLLRGDHRWRDDQFARQRHDRALDRHQQHDQRITTRCEVVVVPFKQVFEEVVHGRKKGRQRGLPAERRAP